MKPVHIVTEHRVERRLYYCNNCSELFAAYYVDAPDILEFLECYCGSTAIITDNDYRGIETNRTEKS